MADNAAQLWIITTEETVTIPEVIRGERGGEDIGGNFRTPTGSEAVQTTGRRRVPLDAGALKAQMGGLLQVVGDVFDQATQNSNLQLEEVELAVEINAQGQVSILGNGGSLSDKGAIKLKFKRAAIAP